MRLEFVCFVQKILRQETDHRVEGVGTIFCTDVKRDVDLDKYSLLDFSGVGLILLTTGHINQDSSGKILAF